jgi:hypothetical protein
LFSQDWLLDFFMYIFEHFPTVLVAMPEDRKEQAEKLKRFIICINEELDGLNIGIKKALDENCR